MTIKVIKDKVYHKGEFLGVGSLITDLDNANAERLCEQGYCTVVDNNENAIEQAEVEETKDLDEMTKKELIAYAESIGVEVSDKETKPKIIEKITQADMPATDIPTE